MKAPRKTPPRNHSRNAAVIVYVPLDEARKPFGKEPPIKNYYWVVHPEKGLVFIVDPRSIKPQPQSNYRKDQVKRMIETFFPDCQRERVSIVYPDHAAQAYARMKKP